MKSSSASAKVNLLSTNGLTGSLLRRGVLRQLTQLKHGQLVVIENGERQVFGTAGSPLIG
ncbi:SAM-dependent methyltransferase, partial [Pseudomonas sp. GW247-3R2A]